MKNIKQKNTTINSRKGDNDMATPALLPPKMDFVFKRIFGDGAPSSEQSELSSTTGVINHPNILISFLNAVLDAKDPIKSVELKDTTIEKSHLEDKWGPHPAKQVSSLDGVMSRLDIKAKTDKGEYINIEIQLKDEKNIIKRSLYYWSKLYESQLESSEKYQTLSRTICINLLDFNLFNHANFHSVYRLKECETHEELTDVIELHFIELRKMKDFQHIEEIQTKLEAWLYFINHPESELVKELEKIELEIKEARDELIRLSGDKRERERYEKRRESLLNKFSALASAKEEGIKQGIEKGLKQGIEKGVEQGVNQRNIEIVKTAIANGFDNLTISKLTGLSVDEIEKIRYEA